MRLTVEGVLEAWQAAMPPRLAAGMGVFLEHNREGVEQLVRTHLGKRSARRGDSPHDVETFNAYTRLVDDLALAERQVAPESDARVLARLIARNDHLSLRWSDSIERFAQEYVDVRAECLLLRSKGWDVVPLMTLLPVMALVSAPGPIPRSRGSYLLFWENPNIAIQGPRSDRQFTKLGFRWEDRRSRYAAPASDMTWQASVELIESLTPTDRWSTPDNATLSRETGLNYADSYWTEPKGSRARGPRLADRPFAQTVVMVRNSMGSCSHDPDRGLSPSRFHRQLKPAISEAEETLLKLRDAVRMEHPSNTETLRTYARKMWKLARSSTPYPSRPV